MYYRKPVYILTVALSGLGSIAAAVTLPENKLIFLASGHAMLAVLTFPMGAAASAIGFFLIFLGVATSTESMFLMLPVHAILGYIQWFRLFPAIYRANR